MKLIPKVLVIVLPITGILLIIMMLTQGIFMNRGLREMAESDILLTTGLLEEFVASGQMETFIDILGRIDKEGQAISGISNVALFTKEYKSNMYSGKTDECFNQGSSPQLRNRNRSHRQSHRRGACHQGNHGTAIHIG